MNITFKRRTNPYRSDRAEYEVIVDGVALPGFVRKGYKRHGWYGAWEWCGPKHRSGRATSRAQAARLLKEDIDRQQHVTDISATGN